MRDPKRIDETLDVIRGIWKRSPDLRLTQLIMNAVYPTKDPFYIEDEDLVKRLKDFSKKLKNI